jgi:hypothetical protein
MGGYGFFVAFFRFVTFTPFFWFSQIALSDWEELRKHNMPPAVLWARNLHIGLGIAGVKGSPRSVHVPTACTRFHKIHHHFLQQISLPI